LREKWDDPVPEAKTLRNAISHAKLGASLRQPRADLRSGTKRRYRHPSRHRGSRRQSVA
jgi:hypothetical protein